MGGSASTRGPFTWPPARGAEQARGTVEPSPGRPGARAWHGVERYWFGMTRAPLAARAEAAGWSPDPSGGYCPGCGTSAGAFEVERSDRSPLGGTCAACRVRRPPWDHFVRLGVYEGLLKALVREVKFTRWRALGTELGRLLGARVAAELARAGIEPERVVIVPVPMSWGRRVGRGIDHALVLARGVSAATGSPLVRALRRSHRPPQTEVPTSARAANVRGSMRSIESDAVAGRVVVLVDDVRTTGATLREACRALRGERRSVSDSSPAIVIAAVLASAGERGRRTAGAGGAESGRVGSVPFSGPSPGVSGDGTGIGKGSRGRLD